MKTFLAILSQHIHAHETSARGRMKKKYDVVYRRMMLEAKPYYEQWLITKFNYFPTLTYVDAEQATKLCEREIPDFDFYVRMAAANLYLKFFGKYILTKSKQNIERQAVDFEFDDGN